MSDEAHFHSSGCVNKENFCYWIEENPQRLRLRPLHSARVTVWCGVANFGVVGPYFFADVMKCMLNKMEFNKFNKLKIIIKFHCFLYFRKSSGFFTACVHGIEICIFSCLELFVQQRLLDGRHAFFYSTLFLPHFSSLYSGALSPPPLAIISAAYLNTRETMEFIECRTVERFKVRIPNRILSQI
jgi:hypothetical protein